MKRLFPMAAIGLLAATAATSCSDDKDTWEEYADWREFNINWMASQQSRLNPDGTPYYTPLVSKTNPDGFVLVHYFNDRSQTADNLSPLFTSVIDTRYEGYLADSTFFDSSTNLNTNGPGIYRTNLSGVIMGWKIVLQDMHVGDTCEVLIPYQLAYGQQASGVIKPYSSLRFNMRLVDIVKYEASPYY